MNPLDWTGPQFLLFYAALVALVLLLVRQIRGATDPEPARLPRLVDPAAIALLRNGPAEAIHVAALDLFDRGLLLAVGDKLQLARPDAVDLATSPLDRAILARLRDGAAAVNLLSDGDVVSALAVMKRELRSLGLVGAASCPRFLLWLGANAVLLGLAATKILLALERGRHNVGLLVVMALVAPIGVTVVAFRRRTRAGDRLLADMETLFSSARRRASAGQGDSSSGERALLAAVFGTAVIAALPGFATAALLFRATGVHGSGGWGSSSSCASSSSSCSSSSSSSSSCSGGSCGGGSCGGGCGGCGG